MWVYAAPDRSAAFAFAVFDDRPDALYCGAGDDVLAAVTDVFVLRFPDTKSIDMRGMVGRLPSMDQMPVMNRSLEEIERRIVHDLQAQSVERGPSVLTRMVQSRPAAEAPRESDSPGE